MFPMKVTATVWLVLAELCSADDVLVTGEDSVPVKTIIEHVLLTSIGPFDLVDTGFSPSDFTVDGTTWTLQHEGLRGPAARVVAQSSWRNKDLFGHLSAMSKLTLNDSEKLDAGVPAGAESFGWSYPIAPSLVTNQDTQYNPVISLLNSGGFVYFDANDAFLSAVTMSKDSSGGLQFSGPRSWDSNWTKDLGSEFFQPVVEPDYLRAGARLFAWMPPQLGGPVKCKNGCFVFLFHEFDDDAEELTTRDCYFAVLPEHPDAPHDVGDKFDVEPRRRASSVNFKVACTIVLGAVAVLFYLYLTKKTQKKISTFIDDVSSKMLVEPQQQQPQKTQATDQARTLTAELLSSSSQEKSECLACGGTGCGMCGGLQRSLTGELQKLQPQNDCLSCGGVGCGMCGLQKSLSKELDKLTPTEDAVPPSSTPELEKAKSRDDGCLACGGTGCGMCGLQRSLSAELDKLKPKEEDCLACGGVGCGMCGLQRSLTQELDRLKPKEECLACGGKGCGMCGVQRSLTKELEKIKPKEECIACGGAGCGMCGTQRSLTQELDKIKPREECMACGGAGCGMCGTQRSLTAELKNLESKSQDLDPGSALVTPQVSMAAQEGTSFGRWLLSQGQARCRHFLTQARADDLSGTSWELREGEYRVLVSVRAPGVDEHMYNDGDHARDEPTGLAVVEFACQGPAEIGRWLVNFKSDLDVVQFGEKKGTVHREFASVYLGIRRALYERLKTGLGNLNVQPEAAGSRLWVVSTGHGAGGAIAAIAAYDMTISWGCTVNCVTWGMPRVGDQDFAESYAKSVPSTAHFQHRDDVVVESPSEDGAPITSKRKRIKMAWKSVFVDHQQASFRSSFMSNGYKHLVECNNLESSADLEETEKNSTRPFSLADYEQLLGEILT
uniref:Fungal lipase-type domain-containing protein n=1 Tax=Noctiluca scintillans TaxID=2966 RepID=A0A7S1AID4_NOCSC|mmetsp:Transcript_46756/g.124071  ORF Transcript_46756/g.124071 Transcript_46756/m.124071 type:complete len:894 (+) Transcript_46756:88-2769(+)